MSEEFVINPVLLMEVGREPVKIEERQPCRLKDEEDCVYYIYKITNILDGKVYIGQTYRNIDERFKEHCNEDSNCLHIKYAIQKYGANKFKIELVCMAYGQKDVDYWEEYFIDKYDSANPINGYNIRKGGSAGKHTQATKSKISKSMRKYTEAQYIEMIDLYSNGKMLLCDICKKYDCDMGVVYAALDRAGLEKNGGPKNPFEQEVVNLYKQNVQYKDITIKTGCTAGTIIAIVRRNNLPMRNPSEIKSEHYEPEIIELYKQNVSFDEISEIIGCSKATITNVLNRNKILNRKILNTAKRDVQIVELFKQNVCYTDIMKIVNCGAGTIVDAIKRNKIPLRRKNKKA